MKAYRELLEKERALLREILYLGKKPEAVEGAGEALSERSIWRRRKSIIDRILDVCNARRKNP